MKTKIAFLLNAALVVVASMFISTNSIATHRPELPEELLK
ncbi:AgrD family cyclic lactone autoinducer peptide [Paenibacillus chartarius]|uniref:AgrD family cyclic lactone autoinducer peptide n=1 Tax=Paenibacillus chartarius TaxID=747481 RepID=A0ABV6DRS4_9BACL